MLLKMPWGGLIPDPQPEEDMYREGDRCKRANKGGIIQQLSGEWTLCARVVLAIQQGAVVLVIQ